MLKKTITLLITLLLLQNLYAQKEKNNNSIGSVDLDLVLAFPSNEFEEYYPYQLMGGLSFSLYRNISPIVEVGGRLDYYWMSRKSEKFSDYSPQAGDLEITSIVKGGVIPFYLSLRISPLASSKSPIQPYIEGLSGFRVFFANHKLNTLVLDTEETYTNTDRNTSSAWSYGYGGGIKILIDKKGLVFLNFKMNKLYGNTTEVMDPKSVVIEDGNYSFTTKETRTDMVSYSFGLHVRF